MKFIYGKNDWNTIERGQENCYLLTNGLGGFSSLTTIASNARNDHALLMACLQAPNNRYNLISNIGEKLKIGNKSFILTSQEKQNPENNLHGYRYLSKFTFEDIPEWTYNVSGVEIIKTIAMKQKENTICIKYVIRNYCNNDAFLEITPYLEFVKKGELLNENQKFLLNNNTIQSNGINLNFKTNGTVISYDTKFNSDLLFSHDERDGREKLGITANNHDIKYKIPSKSLMEFYIIYSTSNITENVDEIISDAIEYRNELVNKSKIKNNIGQTLVKSANQFLVDRESTNGRSIIAGYPFFEDWGRDTMIALCGCCISTQQFEDAKSIFRTFIYYCKKGIMPNLFPEGKNNAMYNTVDASLIFINTLYEYYEATKDIDFIKEVYPVVQDIIYWYRRGTDFNIHMDNDGLIIAGSGLDQVTWMDVKIGEILPTPRHGKPVEINAYWYSALKIAHKLGTFINADTKDYNKLAEQVKENFIKKFWNEQKHCLRDIVSGSINDDQVRCNQIWAISMRYSMLNKEQSQQVLDTVYENLYTPYGLRTLSPDDPEFKGFYGGTQLKRDLAYHQGTVWAYPLGAFYIAYLKVNDYSNASIKTVKKKLEVFEACLREGCISQVAEIFDGENPSISKGCFAQAWSVSEILKVYKTIEEKELS